MLQAVDSSTGIVCWQGTARKGGCVCTGNVRARCTSLAPAPPFLVLLLQKYHFCKAVLPSLWVGSLQLQCHSTAGGGSSRRRAPRRTKGAGALGAFMFTRCCLVAWFCVALSFGTPLFVSLTLSPGCPFVYQLLTYYSTSVYSLLRCCFGRVSVTAF